MTVVVGVDGASVTVGRCTFLDVAHFHADHFFDIIFLLLEQGLRHVREHELILIGPAGFAARVDQLFELSYPGVWADIKGNVSPHFVELGEDGGDWSGNGYRIRALRMKHAVDDVTHSSQPNIVFPTDGQRFELNANGLV